ncbi:hypothetical protein [Paenibacillus physcomitrellae]|uniref:Uncharacterized protein n=1 Tax=Paenibacillus physcomitrellae TaxID=1619311 RepID=A0ABQ1FRG4_9BACL|nr:hypothetical protein [Paenibacillus physcomitrellae]GGA27986.1 hypothetical protein GCM10010917_11150 [Paenibacillus physcomitrellae]
MDEKPRYSYPANFHTKGTGQRVDPYPKHLRWFEETESFETLREAEEWVSSDAYNKIGHEYDGYTTTDPMLAYALVFQLVRQQKVRIPHHKVCASEDYGKTITYYVWLEPRT